MSNREYLNALFTDYQIQEYQIESVLGVGGFGITYRAKDTQLNQTVALKEYLPNEMAVRDGTTTVRPKSPNDTQNFNWGRERFIEEAQTLALFKHPNIVRVHRLFEANNTGYMVMDYEKGASLSQFMKNQGKPLEESALLSMLLMLLSGLEKVHAANFLHRDIKPANIFMRSEDGSPVLLDFGAARQAIGNKSKSLTAIVTPGYAPFEQYYSDGNQGPWTDIYALGAVLYRAVSGQVPPEAPRRVKNDPFIPAVEVGQGRYSAGFLKAIDWALTVDELKRPHDVMSWREAFTASGRVRPHEAPTQYHGKTLAIGAKEGGASQGERRLAARKTPANRRIVFKIGKKTLMWTLAGMAALGIAWWKGLGGEPSVKNPGPVTDVDRKADNNGQAPDVLNQPEANKSRGEGSATEVLDQPKTNKLKSERLAPDPPLDAGVERATEMLDQPKANELSGEGSASSDRLDADPSRRIDEGPEEVQPRGVINSGSRPNRWNPDSPMDRKKRREFVQRLREQNRHRNADRTFNNGNMRPNGPGPLKPNADRLPPPW